MLVGRSVKTSARVKFPFSVWFFHVSGPSFLFMFRYLCFLSSPLYVVLYPLLHLSSLETVSPAALPSLGIRMQKLARGWTRLDSTGVR
ncbi:hypothetical protein EV361DRAFT_939407 [Lentinula raphanica]|nr:hypothetical protein EV361DRAFT_939407 [Lentinula raphanica]